MSETNVTAQGGFACPHCKVDLVMSERQGIEIDYCPKCRGIWLDRGELDKIIEKSLQDDPRAGSVPQQAAAPAPAPGYGHNDYGHGGSSYGGHGSSSFGGHGGGSHGGRRQGSFLSRLFD